MQGVKTLNPRARRCPICSSPSKKKGFTKQGRQRWYCKECKYSFTATDDRQKHAQEFGEFLTYITTVRWFNDCGTSSSGFKR
ncbi:IS1/IS1595 family N-terminal zinc-binding domain-containing protein [Actinotignum timonense]